MTPVYLQDRSFLLVSSLALIASCSNYGDQAAKRSETSASSTAAQLVDVADGRDWPGFGRTYGEQHFSPLSEINQLFDKLASGQAIRQIVIPQHQDA